jgi:hypothetical protein
VSQNTEPQNDALFFLIPFSTLGIIVTAVIRPVALEIIVGPIVIVVDWLLNIKPFDEYIN